MKNHGTSLENKLQLRRTSTIIIVLLKPTQSAPQKYSQWARENPLFRPKFLITRLNVFQKILLFASEHSGKFLRISPPLMHRREPSPRSDSTFKNVTEATRQCNDQHCFSQTTPAHVEHSFSSDAFETRLVPPQQTSLFSPKNIKTPRKKR